MPDLSRREKELRESFKLMEPHIKWGEAVECGARLGNLYPARAAALLAILEPLADSSCEPRARAVEDKIQVFVDRWVLPLSKLCDGLLYPGEEMDGWREYEATREMQFMQRLFDLEIGETRDAMAALEAGLVKMIEDLEKKWATMGEEARRIEQIEAEASEKMSAIVTQGIHDGTDFLARYGNELGEILEICNKFPDLVNAAVVAAAKAAGLPDKIAEAIPKVSLMGKDYFQFGKDNGMPASELAKANPELFRDPGMFVSESIQKAIGPEFEAFVTLVNAFRKSVVPVLQARYAEQVLRVRNQLPNHGAILVTFSQTRRDVDEFLRDHGMDKARELMQRLDERLLSWIGSLPTEGQKADARELAEAMRVPFQKRYEHMTNIFGVFVQAHQGRFVGSVNKAVENQIIFTDDKAEREKGLLSLSMDERLTEWRRDTLAISDTLATASAQMFARVRYLPDDIRENILRKLNEYWAGVTEKLRRETTESAAELAQLQVQFADDEVRRTFDPRPLQQRLTA